MCNAECSCTLVQICEGVQIQQLQAQIAVLTIVLGGRNGSGAAPSSPAVVDGPELAAAHTGSGAGVEA